MKLSIYTYNSTAINDGTNYKSWFLTDTLQGNASIVDVNRSGRRPVYAAKVLNGHETTIVIQLRGTVESQLDTMKTLFDVGDETPRKLICKDTADSDKQWYVYATPTDMSQFNDRDTIQVTLSIADPVWYEETESSDAWTITASGQTNEVTVAGNLPARPRFVFTPTSAGGSRYTYRRLALWRNPNAVAMLNYPLNIVNTVWDTGALVADVTRSVVINDVDGIAVDDVTITYDGETGTFPTAGMAYVGTEQISYTGKTATELTGVTRGINGTTAATHANDMVIYASIIQADGDDVRVFVDGAEVPRWLQGINTANTKVWITLDLNPHVVMTLLTPIADSGAVSLLTFAKTKTNAAYMKLLPPSGQILIDSELFTYTGVSLTGYYLTGVTRAAKGTSMAAHTATTSCYWIQHEIFIYYGNQTASAPDTDDTRKPMFDLTSTNTSWVYTSFWESTGMRAGAWKPALVSSYNKTDLAHKSNFYTGNRDTEADPATEMGAIIKAWQSGVIWKADNPVIDWVIYNPATFTEITATGEKYRVTTNWPANAKLYKSANGSTWVAVWTEATPSAAATWEALASHSAVSLSTGYKYLMFRFNGSVGATADNYAALEVEGATLTLSSSYVPQGSFNAAEGCYYVDGIITNNTSGEWLRFVTSTTLNTAITIDCENKKAYLADNSPVTKIELSTVRKDWLNLSVGTNELKFDDTGTAGASLPVYWRDRNS